jgi:hypothetical protein
MKGAIDFLRAVAPRIAALERDKAACIDADDFDGAKQCKIEAEALRAQVAAVSAGVAPGPAHLQPVAHHHHLHHQQQQPVAAATAAAAGGQYGGGGYAAAAGPTVPPRAELAFPTNAAAAAAAASAAAADAGAESGAGADVEWGYDASANPAFPSAAGAGAGAGGLTTSPSTAALSYSLAPAPAGPADERPLGGSAAGTYAHAARDDVFPGASAVAGRKLAAQASATSLSASVSTSAAPSSGGDGEPEELSAANLKDAEPVLQILGEHLVRCSYSKALPLRQQAARDISDALDAGRTVGVPDTGTAPSPAELASAVVRVLKRLLDGAPVVVIAALTVRSMTAHTMRPDLSNAPTLSLT